MVHTDVRSRSSPFGKLAEAAAKLTPPKDVPLKDRQGLQDHRQADSSDSTRRKRSTARRSSASTSSCRACSWRPSSRSAGVRRQGEELRRRQGEGDSRRAARRPDRSRHRRGGRRLLAGDEGTAKPWRSSGTRDRSPRSTAQTQREEYAALAKKPGAVATKDGDAAAVLGKAPRSSKPSTTCPIWRTRAWSRMNCVGRCDEPTVATSGPARSFRPIDRAAPRRRPASSPSRSKLHTTLARRRVWPSRRAR